MTAIPEVRLALVINGGVSLAVWMGGVTHEVNRLRLASSSKPVEELGLSAQEQAVHLAWQAVLEATGRSVVVDAIAGSSAGGLNGSILAAAIAGGRDLPPMGEVWSTVASLSSPLLNPEGSADYSLLDGEHFEGEIENVLAQAEAAPAIVEQQDCALLVTATSIGKERLILDLEGGTTASFADSRRVYRFLRRTDDVGVTDTLSGNLEARVRAARASAGFPVAFAPVAEKEEMTAARVDDGIRSPSWLVDGGLLDNAPFEPLIKELRERPVNAPFERVLLYIKPSVDPTGVTEIAGTPRLSDVLGQMVGAIREPDQRLDLDMLERSFRAMGYRRSAPDNLLRTMLSSGEVARDAIVGSAVALLPSYRLARAEAVQRQLDSIGRRPPLSPPPPSTLAPDDLAGVPPQLDPGLPDEEGTWRWGLSTASRIARWWGRLLVAEFADTEDVGGLPVLDEAFEAVAGAQRALGRLSRDLEACLAGADSRNPPLAAYNAFLTAHAGTVRDLMDEASGTVAVALGIHGMTGATVLEASLAIEVVSSMVAWAEEGEGDALTFRYRQITPASTSLFDLEEAGLSSQWPSRKLYGEQWGHFGAFASAAGRKADWLWGRIDGASALFDFLLAHPANVPPISVEERAELRSNLASAILAAEGADEATLLKEAQATLSMSGGDLLRGIPEADRTVLLDDLAQQVKRILRGEAPPQDGTAPGWMYVGAALDPTWSSSDLSDLSAVRRFFLRCVRLYGLPARWHLMRKARRRLGI